LELCLSLGDSSRFDASAGTKPVVINSTDPRTLKLHSLLVGQIEDIYDSRQGLRFTDPSWPPMCCQFYEMAKSISLVGKYLYAGEDYSIAYEQRCTQTSCHPTRVVVVGAMVHSFRLQMVQ
jgi:hypothetical protein